VFDFILFFNKVHLYHFIYQLCSSHSSRLAITTANTNMIAMTLPVVRVFRTVRIFATSQIFLIVHWFNVISSNRVADVKENSTLSADV
jgi:hypothetical protein